ncbi:MAG TPA: SurA N-terminal domain-containing protein [Tepidisphaeraceae bacterium]|nr:SurA N-terminal domain-containing protein [Tepidisphaeraceae bacterium]
MYRFMQKNKKKLLAVFAAFLMIVFILPAGLDQFGGGGRDPVLAKLGDEEIHASEFQQAEQEWRMLSELRAGGPRSQFGAQLPFAYRLGWDPATSEMDLFTQGAPPLPVRAITGNPRLYLLLQREAQRMGIAISDDRANEVLVNELAGAIPPDKQSADRLRRAIANFLAVQVAFDRGSSVIKVSDPAVQHELARRTQNVTVNVSSFPAAEYAEKVPAPTTQQLQAHFQKYKDVSPVVDPKENPFGFGYRYPNRATLQYISVPRENVRKMVEASRTDYEWEVEASKYYLQNQSQFPTTQGSQPATGPATTQSTTTASAQSTTQAKGPTTRPFEEVRDDAKARIVVPEVERRAAEIQSRIAAIMAADYQAFRSAVPEPSAGSTQPTKAAPNSSQGVPYNSYEYLQRLAQTIQRDFNVLPTVAAYDDQLRTQEELAALPLIGAAMADETNQPFAQYITTAAQPFLPEDQRDSSGALPLLAPSRPLRDPANNAYIVRLTAADPAHAPATLAEVEEAVRADVIAAAAFEQARSDAAKLLEQAKQTGLRQAAQSGQRNVLTVGPFPFDIRGKLPGLELENDDSTARFAEGAFDLLATPAPREGAKPVGLIELPNEGKVYVAELADVHQRPQMAMFGGDTPGKEIERGLLQELRRVFEMHWFNFEDIKQRLNYVATEAARDEREPQAPRTPLPRPLPM